MTYPNQGPSISELAAGPSIEGEGTAMEKLGALALCTAATWLTVHGALEAREAVLNPAGFDAIQYGACATLMGLYAYIGSGFFLRATKVLANQTKEKWEAFSATRVGRVLGAPGLASASNTALAGSFMGMNIIGSSAWLNDGAALPVVATAVGTMALGGVIKGASWGMASRLQKREEERQMDMPHPVSPAKSPKL